MAVTTASAPMNAPMNALVMQSGGCTPVLNRSLYGVAMEAFANPDAIGELYGAVYGVEGMLGGDFAPLSRVSPDEWRRIARTPGAALGSTRRKIRDEDIAPTLAALRSLRVGYLFIIGGNDSAWTGHQIGLAADAAGMDLAVVNIPKTIDNDLALTDHTPGYGSAARFVALAAMGSGRDAESMGAASPVTITEVMGRDAGWLAAAAALGKREERDAPHFIGVPEIGVDETRFLDIMEDAYRRFGFAVAVVAENARRPDGTPIAGDAPPFYTDDFGHAYHDGPARRLAALAARRLGVRARCEIPGTIQRSMMQCASETDAREAELVGRDAVRRAISGDRDVIVALERVSGESGEYACETAIAPLADVGGITRPMPPEFMPLDAALPTQAFAEYATPLIGELPQFGRIR